jgi:hypothetical protein
MCGQHRLHASLHHEEKVITYVNGLHEAADVGVNVKKTLLKV